MNDQHKEFEDIVPADFEISPVWEFALDREIEGNMLVRPVLDLPVSTLANRFIGTPVRLANGRIMPSVITNVTTTDPYQTRHFISLCLYRGEWFDLARYHDVDIERHGPSALADFLGLSMKDVFPIAYDLRAYCTGDPAALAGTIEAEPRERLSDRELRALALS